MFYNKIIMFLCYSLLMASGIVLYIYFQKFYLSVISLSLAALVFYFYITSLRDHQVMLFFSRYAFLYPNNVFKDNTVSLLYSVILFVLLFLFLSSQNIIIKTVSGIGLFFQIPLTMMFIRYFNRSKKYRSINE